MILLEKVEGAPLWEYWDKSIKNKFKTKKRKKRRRRSKGWSVIKNGIFRFLSMPRDGDVGRDPQKGIGPLCGTTNTTRIWAEWALRVLFFR